MPSPTPFPAAPLTPSQLYEIACQPENHRFATVVVALLALIALFQISKAFWGHH